MAPAKIDVGSPAERATADRLFARFVALTLILAVGAAVRFWNLNGTPPGLHQDEAVCIWNAACLSQEGVDQHGVRYPILFTRLFGSNDPVLHIYALIPFQVIFDASLWSMRATIAVIGTATLLAIYAVGNSLFSSRVGLIAAGLCALDPWSIQLSRMYFLAGYSTLLVCAALTCINLSGLPLSDSVRRCRPGIGLLAGLFCGFACYGYWALLIFMPVFLCCVFALTWKRWTRLTSEQSGRHTILAFLIGFVALFGPLAVAHVTNPDGAGRRGQSSLFWHTSPDTYTLLVSIADRYVRHFGIEFLFYRGDQLEMQCVPGWGQLQWYLAPALLVGLVRLCVTAKSSTSARVVLAWLALFPLGDSLAPHISPYPESLHALRSSQGIGALMLVSAVGASSVLHSLLQRSVPIFAATATVWCAWIVWFSIWFLRDYHSTYPKLAEVRRLYHSDLVRAAAWVRDRQQRYDFIFCTVSGFNQPYVIIASVVQHSPANWFAEPRDYLTGGTWDHCTRFGRFHFLYPTAWDETIRSLQRDGVPQRALLILRPGESTLRDPVLTITDPTGRPTLLLFEIDL